MLRNWSRRAASAGIAQAAIQALGLLTALVVIRVLDPSEYAWYTIALGALGAMTVLTDGGAINGVLSLGGRVWQSRVALGAVLATAAAVRARLAWAALALGAPLTAAALLHQGAPWSAALLVTAALVSVFWLTATTQLLEVVPRLHQRVAALQRVQVTGALARLAAVGASVTCLPFAACAIVATLPALVWNGRRLRRLTAEHADLHSPPDPAAAAELRRQTLRTLPSAAYYAFSGQLTVALIAIFGTAQAVATVGALTRLAMALTVLNAVFALLVVPRFARLPPDEPRRVRRRYAQAQLAMAACASVPLAALAAFPSPVVAILGRGYEGLTHEVVLVAAGSALGLLSGLAFQLGAVRGITAPPALLLPYCIGIQAALVASLPVDTVVGVAWIGIGTAASHWLLHVAYFAHATRRRPAARDLSSS